MSLKESIIEDMKSAMRAKDSARLGAIRMLTAAIKQKEVDERIELTDADVMAIVDKLIKQRRDSIVMFDAGGRADLSEKEKGEVEVLAAYLPKQLGPGEIEAEITSVLAGLEASGPQAMGKVMAALKPRLAGKADMTAVSALVKKRLLQG